MRSVTLSAAQLGRATRVLPRTNPAVISPVNNLWLKLMAILLRVKMNGTLQMSKMVSFDALEKLKCRSFSENFDFLKPLKFEFSKKLVLSLSVFCHRILKKFSDELKLLVGLCQVRSDLRKYSISLSFMSEK